jgi:vitamin B12 transporter
LKKTIILSILASTAVLADTTMNIDKITVTASHESVEKHLLTADVESVGKKNIENEGYRGVSEILESKLSFSSQGGFGQTESFYLRGMDNGRTLFLIDGVRANDITGVTTAAFSQHLLLDDIDGVEIIKGAQSGVYGADAVAGVVSVTTEKPQEGLHAKLGSTLGSYGYVGKSASISYKNDLLYAKAIASKTEADGFSASAPKKNQTGYGKFDSSLEADRYSNAYTSFLLGVTPTKNDSIEANYKKIDAYTAYDGGWPTNPNDDSSYTNIRQRFLSANYKHSFDNGGSVKAFYNESTFDRTQFGGYSGVQKEFGAEAKYSYLKNSYLSSGINRVLNEVKTSGGSPLDKGFDSTGIFVSNTNLFDNLLLTQNIRKDFYSSFEDKTTGKIGAKLFLQELEIFANYALGYTTPTAYQLYGDGGMYVAASGVVNPENSKSFDTGFEYRGLKVSYFYNKIENLIAYTDPDGWGPQPGHYYNISGNSIVQGYEASYKARIGDFGVGASYQRLDAKDANKNKLANRPSYTASSSVRYYFGDKANIGANIEYIGDRVDYDKANTGNYALANISAKLNAAKNIELFVKAKNILNRYYQTVDGYNGYGASIYAGANIKF